MSSVFSEKAAVAAEKKAAAAAKQAEKVAVAAAKQAEKAAAKAAKEAEKEAEKAAKQAARDEKKAAAAALAAAKAALPKRPVGRPRKNTASVSDSVSVHSGPVLGPATVGAVGLVTRTPTLAQLMAEIAELRTRLAAQTAAYTDVCGRLDTIRHTLMV